MLSDRGYSAIIYLVSAVWGASMILSMVPGTDYQPNPAIHGIFTAIVGGALIARANNDRKNDNDRGGDHKR